MCVTYCLSKLLLPKVRSDEKEGVLIVLGFRTLKCVHRFVQTKRLIAAN